jgi:hypothetical protein
VVPIGIRWASSDGAVHDLDLRLSAASETVTLASEPNWVIANRGAAGFYRTAYGADLRAALAAVALDVADATERYTLVDDTWVSVLAGSTPVSGIIELISGLTAEDDLAVWRRIGGVLANLHRVAVGDAAATEAVAGFDRVLTASQSATTPQDTLRYLGALADARDAKVFNRFLDLLTGDDVRTQDVGGLLNRGLMNPTNAAAAWAFTEGNWESLGERLPSNAISRMVSGVRTFTDTTLATRVAHFFETHPVPQAAKAFAQHTERMQVMVTFTERARAGLAVALASG